MKMKVLAAVLAALFLAGCEEWHDKKYQSEWRDTGVVTVRSDSTYRVDLERPDHSVLSGEFCMVSGKPDSLRIGMVIEMRYRVINRYSYSDEPCWQVDSWRVVKDVQR